MDRLEVSQIISASTINFKPEFSSTAVCAVYSVDAICERCYKLLCEETDVLTTCALCEQTTCGSCKPVCRHSEREELEYLSETFGTKRRMK
jgi:ferredoxin-like protein FixX